MSAGKRTADAAYDRTGYANVADKFVICVQREGSFSITTEDCRNLLALISERDAMRDALRYIIEWNDGEWNAETARDKARAALALADGAK